MPLVATAAIVRGPEAGVTVERVEMDSPGPGEVLVRLLASGICHSDLHYKRGTVGDEFPFVLGHEGAGLVEALGDGVESVAVGDYVTLSYRAPCGDCRFCRSGRIDNCMTPATPRAAIRTADGLLLTRALGLGTFADRLVVDQRQAIAIDRSCPPAPASILGCGVMTGVGAVLYTAAVQPGDTVAVFGCGGVGGNVIQGARIARAGRIFAVDLVERKLAWARELGATDTIDASSTDPVAAIRRATDGRGVAFAFEAVGLPATLRQALGVLDYRGTAVMVGFPSPTATLELELQPYFFTGANLRVTLGGDGIPGRDLPLLVEWYRRGDLELDRLITRTVGHGDVDLAFAAMEGGEALRSVLVFAETVPAT